MKVKYCNSCKVLVDNPVPHCPLCYSTLVQHDNLPESPSYPDYQRVAKRYHLILRILVMISLSAASICLAVNLMTGAKPFLWSLIVIAAIIYLWIVVFTTLRKHVTLGFKILIQVLSLSGLFAAVDQIIGHYEFAYDYVLPGLFTAATLTLTILIIVKRVRFKEFILYFLLTALMGFIPLILLAVGLVRISWPTTACAIYAGLSLVSMFIFADHATKIELKKRFHI